MIIEKDCTLIHIYIKHIYIYILIDYIQLQSDRNVIPIAFCCFFLLDLQLIDHAAAAAAAAHSHCAPPPPHYVCVCALWLAAPKSPRQQLHLSVSVPRSAYLCIFVSFDWVHCAGYLFVCLFVCCFLSRFLSLFIYLFYLFHSSASRHFLALLELLLLLLLVG